MRPNSRILLITRFLLGSVFLVAGISKAYDLFVGRFAQDSIFGAMATSHKALAWSIVGLEVVLGGALLTGWMPAAASAVVIVFLAAALGVLAREYRQPAPRACGCTSLAVTKSTPSQARADLRLSMLFNGLLISSAIPLWLISARRGTRNVQASALTEVA